MLEILAHGLIRKVCSKAFRGLCNIRQIRKYLPAESTKCLMHLSMLSPRVGEGGVGGRATHGKLTERAFPRVGNLTWPPSWKTERNWK